MSAEYFNNAYHGQKDHKQPPFVYDNRWPLQGSSTYTDPSHLHAQNTNNLNPPHSSYINHSMTTQGTLPGTIHHGAPPSNAYGNPLQRPGYGYDPLAEKGGHPPPSMMHFIPPPANPSLGGIEFLPGLGSTGGSAGAALSIIGQQVLKSKQEEMSRWIGWPIHKLKPYFQVTNDYVWKKCCLILFPFKSKSWQRLQANSNDNNGLVMSGSMPVVSANDHPSTEPNYTSVPVFYALPKEDIFAPDIYIPTMSFVTYVVLVGIIFGMDGKFQPDVLGMTASTAFGFSLIELVLIKLGCYFLSFGNDIPLLDILSYVGYKYVGLVLTLLVGCFFSGLPIILTWLYVGIAFSFFLLRSLRHAILPTIHSSYYDSSTLQNRRKRVHFLLILALLQLAFSYFLIVQPSSAASVSKTGNELSLAQYMWRLFSGTKEVSNEFRPPPM